MATGGPSKDEHCHYIYDLQFNKTMRKDAKMKKCNNKTNGRLYKGIEHCLFVETHSGLRKKASERRVEKY